MTDVTLKVEGMSCGHCKAAVEKALKGLPGVAAVAVDLAAKEVAVRFDGTEIGIDAIKSAIDDAGYDVVS
ncbi:copper chaperone CopZ [Heliobacterium undosum]|uniref:Copper chaperone CopZ n=1 Tax=Heliomicrobium undosum TaxID=121734 RepID=A0A845L5G7_9FIRM|nr:copper chaperone CopZ [Heliomicrobium undosum]MZP29910.1 copper chaperone CopZ [Heliomicrobium undosum]